METKAIQGRPSDQEIWKRFKAGEQAAFNMMFDIYLGNLISYGRKLCSDVQLVEDCIQDTFTEIWFKRERLSDTDSIKYYLYKALRRKMNRRLKKESKTYVFPEINQALISPLEGNQEAKIISKESEFLTRLKLDRAVEKLPLRQKEAIQLRYYKEQTFKEVSGTMGIGMKSTYRVVGKAIEKLQDSFGATKKKSASKACQSA